MATPTEKKEDKQGTAVRHRAVPTIAEVDSFPVQRPDFADKGAAEIFAKAVAEGKRPAEPVQV